MLEVAYHAMNAGQSISLQLPRKNACDARTVPDTAERVYHGTSLAAASLIIRGGFISCAFMEDSFVMFSLAVFLPFVCVFIILSITKHNKPFLGPGGFPYLYNGIRAFIFLVLFVFLCYS